MSAPRTLNLNDGKLIKDIDFQILMCREKIRNHLKSIEKVKRMAGMNGPAGIGGVDYSGMPHAGFSHMNFPDALASIAKDEEYIAKERETIRSLQRRRRNLIRAVEKLEGVERSVFVCRVIDRMTQGVAADAIGISVRQLQRIERKMRGCSDIFGL